MKRAGRPLVSPAAPRTARELLRRHLREEGLTISGDLARAWGVTDDNARKAMTRTRWPLAAARIEQAIALLRLDEFDAQELRLAAARDAGWRLDLALVLA